MNLFSEPASFFTKGEGKPPRWSRRGVVAALAVMPFFLYPSARRALRARLLPAPHIPLAYPYLASPNMDERPLGTVLSCIVLHATVAPTLEETEKIFLDPARKVSAHFVVGKEGTVVQMVPIERRAWHAGVSVLDGVEHVNDFSVGIEMVNLNDGSDPFPDAQYQAVSGLIRFLRAYFPIPDPRIVSHAQIALPAGRKSDPLGFDFEKVRALARQQP